MSRRDDGTGSFGGPSAELPVELARLLEDVCDSFERAWRAGGRPEIGAAVAELPEAIRAAAGRELVALDVFYRRQAGEAPAAADYADRFPALDPDWLATAVGGESVGGRETPGRPTGTPNDAPRPDVGTVIAGRYKLIERPGEGGMGEVFMAQQTEPVKRLVAVKLIKAGMDSRQVLARFEAERQALALMDHPNIAKVLDAGATAAGRPYFVMELVKGVPITRFCDELRLSPRERLELFVPVCQAVQHAHQKGVIHRDIKPSNVLVARYDDRPVPKVIDFGVAKAAGQPLTDHTLVTGFGAVVGTPEYMSPEQASFNALDVDTRSDVYALGVLLYELLTGTTPLDRKRFGKAALLEILRLVREQEVPRPSTRLSTTDALPTIAANRHTDPAKLSKLVRGDLDWVVMKAVEKDRTRRYETANGLGRDIQRFLADEPVEARPPSVGYKLRRFVRRNRGPVLAAAVVILALVGGVVGTTRGLVEARSQRDAADAARRDEADQRAIAVAERDEREKARAAAEDQRKAAVAEKDRAEREKRRADEEAAVARAVGDFLADDLLRQADVGEQAFRGEEVVPDLTIRQALDRAADRIEKRFRGQPLAEAGVRHAVGTAYLAFQDVRAIAQLERALALRELHLGPSDPQTLGTGCSLGTAYRYALRLPEAVKTLERVVERLRAAGNSDGLLALFATSELGVAYLHAGRAGDAVPLLEAAAARSRIRYGEESGYTLGVEHSLAHAYQTVGRAREAVPIMERSLRHSRATRGPHHKQTLTYEGNLGLVLHQLGRLADAEPHLRLCFEGRLKVMGELHPWTLAAATELARLYRDTGRPEEAEALALRAVRACRRADLPADHPGTRKVVSCLADLYRIRGKIAELEQLLADDLSRLRPVAGPDHPTTVELMIDLGICHRRQGKSAEAENVLREAWAACQRGAGVKPGWTGIAGSAFGLSLIDRGKFAEAEPVLRAALTLREKSTPRSGTHYAAKSILGVSLLGQRKFAETEPLLVEGYTNWAKRRPNSRPTYEWYHQSEAVDRLIELYIAWGKPEEAARWRAEGSKYGREVAPMPRPR